MMPQRAFRTVGVALVLAAHHLAAQGAPPARLVRDSQPGLMKPKTVSAPPSTVAPRPRTVRATKADSAPVVPMKRVGLPVDSLRPKGTGAAAVDSLRAPRRQAPPARPTAAVTRIPQAAQASLRSDAAPAGATARCKDGSFATGPVDANTCASNGGLAARLPSAPATPPPPRRP